MLKINSFLISRVLRLPLALIIPLLKLVFTKSNLFFLWLNILISVEVEFDKHTNNHILNQTSFHAACFEKLLLLLLSLNKNFINFYERSIIFRNIYASLKWLFLINAEESTANRQGISSLRETKARTFLMAIFKASFLCWHLPCHEKNFWAFSKPQPLSAWSIWSNICGK